MVWLPVDFFMWHLILRLSPMAIAHFSGVSRPLETAHTRVHKLHLRVEAHVEYYQVYQTLLHDLPDPHTHPTQYRDHRQEAMRTAAELVIQTFIIDVLRALTERAVSTHVSTRAEFRDHLGCLTSDERRGLGGLTHQMVRRIIQADPIISLTRPVRKGRSVARNGQLHFQDYRTGVWADQVNALFCWTCDSTTH